KLPQPGKLAFSKTFQVEIIIKIEINPKIIKNIPNNAKDHAMAAIANSLDTEPVSNKSEVSKK
ncbi:MAG: hypothetical protein GX180_13485, partial [Enterococcus sp.]|nr:hypothetical protein [Enterococcus sp.]